MKMSGEELIPASRKTVWKALNDPQVLKQCIPGCDEIIKHSDTSMEAKVTAKVGPVKARFTGNVELSDVDPPNGYRISGTGQGGLAGFAKGGATVKLADADGGTRMTYDVDAQIGGKLAMLGSRLIDGYARSMAGQFFEKFAEIAGSMAGESAAESAEASVAEAEEKAMAMKKKLPPKKPGKKKPVKKPAKKKAVPPRRKVAKKKAAKKK